MSTIPHTTGEPLVETGPGSVPVRCFTSSELPPEPAAQTQLRALAAFEGVTQYVAVLPDVHFKGRNPTPTGTVAVTDRLLVPRAIDGGVNCGLRFMSTRVPVAEMTPTVLDALYGRLIERIPLKRHDTPPVTPEQAEAVLTRGIGALVEALDLPHDELTGTENGGRALPQVSSDAIRAVIPEKVPRKEAGSLGTIGAGNHFLELQEIAEVLDEPAARRLGLEAGTCGFMLHTDSRRLGKKILKPIMEEAVGADRDPAEPRLWGVDAESDLGRRLLAALAGAMHAAYANRACVGHFLRAALRDVLGDGSVELRLVSDCGHESIQRETHHGEPVWVHRHGASHVEAGQPVPVAGCLGTDSYLCVAEPGVAEAFCSAAHGAGRVMEKTTAAEVYDEREIESEVARRGVRLYRYHADNIAGQAPASFKDIGMVIEAMVAWKLVRPVARLRPVAVLKG